jgi:LAS superfamily LD-carboxypeptidase LdcB
VHPDAANRDILTGQTESHLCTAHQADALGAHVHAGLVAPLADLRAAAADAGFALAVLSGFRGFDRQLSIWNRKARGELAVLDDRAQPLDVARLTPAALVFAILRWSALPGASRHHWGTDLDVYDAAARPDGYEVELVPAEVEGGGMFAPLHDWLDARIARDEAFGFDRPYDADRGGIAPERWHLSYVPLAADFARHLTPDVLRATLEHADLMLKDTLLAHLDEIVERFVHNVNPAVLRS